MTISDATPAGSVGTEQLVTAEERSLAARNHGFLLEALRYPVTPIGLHYLLIHFDLPLVDESSWGLDIGGRVARAMRLDLAALRGRPAVTRPVTMECAGNGRMAIHPRALSQPWGDEAVGTAAWTGTPLRPLLEEAGLLDGAREVVFSALDSGIENSVPHRFERSLSLDEALRDDVLLVYEINGQPLSPQHGFPLRLIVPGWYGMTNVKWLTQITVVDEPFEGYQQMHSYRWRTDPADLGQPLTRMRPRALMVPPGVPDFFTRQRTVAPGAVELEGRAWSGSGPIRRVEVSTDGARGWVDAVLDPQPDRYAWVRWSFGWAAPEGEHELCCRATDAEGNVQPLDAEWNVGGYVCNAVQRVPVTVRAVEVGSGAGNGSL